jgi:hypothetical protein
VSNPLGRRLDRLERTQSGDILWVIIRQFAGGSDHTPRWTPEGRVMVVHEGHEHLGEELLASLGIASQRPSNEI